MFFFRRRILSTKASPYTKHILKKTLHNIYIYNILILQLFN
ncbi:hypothetical protein Patl1_32630 [Pistacia atlantica]|uniref:Uncharacterized protein n=1 Tax=Pistacia atlantica TaxID=434234 RepID=A0ACC1AME3_9ROSI|nr:hypothetical protein Patl1_32630 [Pistacia atlantica]